MAYQSIAWIVDGGYSDHHHTTVNAALADLSLTTRCRWLIPKTSNANALSAHRTPNLVESFATNAKKNGIKVIIAGAGGAAHLPGVVAAFTSVPVIGVPCRSSISIDGWDSILSILQMPGGVPVATVALNGSKNAGILAAQIIGSFDSKVADKVKAYKKDLEDKVIESSKNLKKNS